MSVCPAKIEKKRMVVQRSPFDGDGSELAHAQTGLQMLSSWNFQEQFRTSRSQEQESRNQDTLHQCHCVGVFQKILMNP